MKYKRVIITHHGSPEVLQVMKDELPEPQAGGVRVKILGTSAAVTDVLVREGLDPGIPPVPFSPGYNNSLIILLRNCLQPKLLADCLSTAIATQL